MNVSRVQPFLQEECQLTPQSLLLIGVSGGADSISLLHCLHQAGWQVTAFHLNHSIRSEAGQDAQFVADFCAGRGIPVVIQVADVPAMARQEHLSMEEAARVERYRRLFVLARQMDAAAVLTAHHAGDQAETVLMHFIRGSGLDGLCGMQPRVLLPEYDPLIPLIRPLLDINRAEIEAYCLENHLAYVTDATNNDQTYFRNWLRNELIPQIEAHNPRFQAGLGRTAWVLSAETELLDGLARQAYADCLTTVKNGLRGLSRMKWLQQSVAIQRRIGRLAIEDLRPNLRDIYFEDIERMRDFFISPPGSGHQDLTAHLVLDMVGDTVWLHEQGSRLPAGNHPQIDGDQPVQLIDRVYLANGWQVHVDPVREVNAAETLWENASNWEAWLDTDRLEAPLCIRARLAGDRFDPLGMGGHSTKISDLLVNRKIPVMVRDRYPLVCDATGRIVWVPGICVSESAAVTAETRRLMHLVVERI